MARRMIAFVGVAFLIFFVAYSPQSAADVFKSIGDTIKDIAMGFGEFFTGLVA